MRGIAARRSISRILSQLTVGAVGLTCKAALNVGYFASVTVSGLHNLLDALGDEESRQKGKGVVTGEDTRAFQRNAAVDDAFFA